MPDPIDGFKLTMPNGDVFRASSNNVSWTMTTNMSYLVGGPQAGGIVQSGIAYAAEWYEDTNGQSNKGDGINQQAAVGSRGVHVFEIQFNQWEGNPDSWGSAASGDDARTKASVLDRAVNEQKIDSESPADLEIGEYNSKTNGLYDPVPVMPLEVNLSRDNTEQASTFSGSMTWFEAMDLTVSID